MRRFTAIMLVGLLTGPPAGVGSAPALGKVEGMVTVSGRPLSGVSIALVELGTGSIVRGISGSSGSFELVVSPGQYLVSTENTAGLVVGRAPTVLTIRPGGVTTAAIDLLALPNAAPQDAQAPAPTQSPALSATTINHEPVECFIEGQFPLLDAGIEPAGSVARARIYFKAARSSTLYYVEMTPSEGRFVGKLPKPRLEASPITYFLQATTTEFGESQIPEVSAIVVRQPDECPDKKVAAFGPPGEVTVFSAASGAAIAPVGFAAGGLALTAGTLALLLGGAAAAGITAAVTVFNPEPTPSPTPSPTPAPTPEPTPAPTPIPTPSPTPSPTPPPPPASPTPPPATSFR